LVLLLFLAVMTYAQDIGAAAVNDIENIMPEKERADVMNEWREWRLENILPDLMREQGIDMWVIINREWIEDPVFFTLVPEPMMASPGCVALIFHDRGEGLGVERLSCAPHGVRGGYERTWATREKTQFEALADAIKKRNPQKIGLNVSRRWGYGDGLTASLKEDLEKALGAEYSSRFVSAGDLCVRWMETRSPQELNIYRHICGVAHDIIAEFFSNKVITPDVTTVDEVRWWTRQRVNDLGLDVWFHPSLSIIRSDKEAAKYDDDRRVIRRGDLLHCDLGIKYLGLCTDMQWQAYVCKLGEDDAPRGLKEALDRANRVADILMGEFEEGKTGKEIADAAMRKAEAEGLRPSIYSHPVGIHGHGAGTTINAVSPGRQDERNVLRWDYPLYVNTCYAIELSSTTTVPEWDNQDVRIGFEETAVFTKEGCKYIDGHQTRYYLIK
jgi:Xaa-Pro aminopeptidase